MLDRLHDPSEERCRVLIRLNRARWHRDASPSLKFPAPTRRFETLPSRRSARPGIERPVFETLSGARRLGGSSRHRKRTSKLCYQLPGRLGTDNKASRLLSMYRNAFSSVVDCECQSLESAAPSWRRCHSLGQRCSKAGLQRVPSFTLQNSMPVSGRSTLKFRGGRRPSAANTG